MTRPFADGFLGRGAGYSMLTPGRKPKPRDASCVLDARQIAAD